MTDKKLATSGPAVSMVRVLVLAGFMDLRAGDRITLAASPWLGRLAAQGLVRLLPDDNE